MKHLSFCFVILMSLCAHSLSAQTEISLLNPSFEDFPRAGGSGYPMPIIGWTDCGQFPKHSPPDIHSADSKFWRVSTRPYDGSTFLGMVTRPDGSNECVWQQLSQPLEKGKTYSLHVFLCQDQSYVSMLSPNGEPVNFNQPAILRIWGGNTGDDDVLLAESDPIDHPDWQEYIFDLIPSRTITYLIIEAYFKNVNDPGAGHVLIDKLKLVKIEE